MRTRSIIIALALALFSGGLGAGCGGGAINPADVSVAVTPEQASVQCEGTVTFTAAVTVTSPSQSTAVTWSVEETGGGTVSTSGQYTAPTTAGTYHVGELGSEYVRASASEFALPEPEAGLFHCWQRIRLALGGPDRGNQALHASCEGPLRRWNPFHPALSRRVFAVRRALHRT